MSEIPIVAQGALWRCFGRFYSRSGDLSHRSNDVVKNTFISEACSLSVVLKVQFLQSRPQTEPSQFYWSLTLNVFELS